MVERVGWWCLGGGGCDVVDFGLYPFFKVGELFFEKGLDVGGDGCKVVLGDGFLDGGLVVFDLLDSVGGLGKLGCEVLTYFCQGLVEEVLFVKDLFSDEAREGLGEFFHVSLEGLA